MTKDIKGYKTLTRYQNKKCYYGIGVYNRKKVFYKEFESPIYLQKEIKGYKIVSKHYHVPKLINYDNNTILYEYKKDLVSNTIYEYLYFNTEKANINSIIKQYKKNIVSIKRMNETKLCNYNFFAKRKEMINTYLLNIKDSEFNNILKDMLNNICQNKSLYAFISQGDPTDTNISVNGFFTDFENGGYNSLVGEISILLVSLLTHGSYFYPKYNSKVYMIRDAYKVNTRISSKNINLILSYLNMVKESLNKRELKELDYYLKYYICFRLLTPIDVLKMDDNDRKIIIKLVKTFYQINSFNDLIDLINNWDICYILNNQ